MVAFTAFNKHDMDPCIKLPSKITVFGFFMLVSFYVYRDVVCQQRKHHTTVAVVRYFNEKQTNRCYKKTNKKCQPAELNDKMSRYKFSSLINIFANLLFCSVR